MANLRVIQLRFQPLSGILAFVVAILSTLASLGVLAGSDGQRVDAWPTPPATYIAIFTAIGNAMMRYAAVQGVAIAWWSKALHGSSVRELHYDWRAGLVPLSVIQAKSQCDELVLDRLGNSDADGAQHELSWSVTSG